ncbi:hypothetical protein F5J12DRAFT_784552 [Pisolithus orientalis]|uniref:uncharacterized protein n=1 Tax=Pisolithus orientalis TaxID=936130 RepID=UPI0022253CF2|nr:uncharacterized protein F5J12DRAFT_784552 [Pisolithus orientalis]KAI5999773.1 hypothetical protein F5J12DRAFT_784552 [Pisolithus orientalis]
MPVTRSSAVTFKVGPPIGAWRSKRVNPTVTSPTKAQPSHGAKAHHQVVKCGNQDTISETHKPMSGDGEECLNCKSSSVAQCPPLQPCSSYNSSQGLTEKERMQGSTRQVALQNSMKLDHTVALEQLQLGIISMEDIVAEKGHKKSVTPNDSEEDEQAVESTVQAEGDLVSENLVDHDGCQAVENSDWSADQRCDPKCEQTLREICAGNYDTDNDPSTPPLPSPSSSEEEDGAADTEGSSDSSVTRRCREAKGKSCALANTSSEDEDGPTSDLSQCEDASSAEAGLPCFKPGQLPLEAIRKAQALGMHTTQEAQVIADEYGKTLGSIMAAAGLTTKATCAESVQNMHQAWYAHTNPKVSAEETKDYYRHHTKHYEDHKDEDKHPQLWAEIWKYWSECVSGSKDISFKAMAQTWCNVEGIHVFRCVIYSGSNGAACQSQGIFAGSSLLMQLNTCPQLSSVIATSKFYLQSYSINSYTITDWPAGVPAVGPDFNVKCLNADELCALTVPFLKESIGADYHAEAPLDDDEDQAGYLVPLLNSSFYLKKWTDDQIELFHHSDARMCDIPLVVNKLNQHLHVLSDSDAFVKALPKGDKFRERSAPSSFPDQPVQG